MSKERNYYNRYKVVCSADHRLPLVGEERHDRVIGNAVSDESGDNIDVWLDAMPVTGVMRLVIEERKDP
jgi:hypothetical protein